MEGIRDGRQARESDRLLKPGEVAMIFRVDPKTVRRWADSGRLASLRTPGGHHRFRQSEIRALLRRGSGGVAGGSGGGGAELASGQGS